MEKIKDERLIIKSLKNIRIAFFVQTFGIMVILIHTGVTEGISMVVQNPAWIVFLISMTVLGFLNLGISADTGDRPEKSHSFLRTLGLIFASSIIVGIVSSFYTGNIAESIITAVILFICFSIPFALLHYLKTKRSENHES